MYGKSLDIRAAGKKCPAVRGLGEKALTVDASNRSSRNRGGVGGVRGLSYGKTGRGGEETSGQEKMLESNISNPDNRE